MDGNINSVHPLFKNFDIQIYVKIEVCNNLVNLKTNMIQIYH